MEGKKTSSTADKNNDWFNSFGKQYGHLPKNKTKLKSELPYDSEILVLAFYSSKVYSKNKDF